MKFIFDLQRFNEDIEVNGVTISYDSTLNAYKIDSAEKLKAMAEYVNGNGTEGSAHDCNGLTFKVTADIDLSSIDNWTPIGNSTNKFKGTFDGGSNEGYTISGLTITGTADNVGLFGYLEGGTVQNVKLADVKISGNDQVGGVVGQNNGTVTGCTVTGTNSKISGNDQVGGIVGHNNGGTVKDNTNSGSVSGTGSTSKVGGIVGETEGNGTISGNTNVGKITGTGDNVSVGEVVGYKAPDVTTTVSNNYYLTGDGDSFGSKQLYKLTLPNDATDIKIEGYAHPYTEIDNSNNGKIIVYAPENGAVTFKSYGELSVNNTELTSNDGTYTYTMPAQETTITDSGFLSNIEFDTTDKSYLIKNVEQLQGLATFVNADKDCDGLTFKLALVDTEGNSINTLDLSSIDNWTPIGNSTNKFKGTFDGGNYTISNLTITGSDRLGLFGLVEGGKITGVNLTNVNITGTGNTVGGVVGQNNGTVEKCTVDGKISGTNDIGGVVGFSEGTVSGCKFISGTINFTGVGSGYHIGGIVGNNFSGTVSDCTISGGTVTGNNSVGGIVGLNDQSTGTVTGCTNSGGTVSGDDYVGGIVGYNSGTVGGTGDDKCTNSGTISGNNNVGGVVGQNNGTVSGVKNSGAVNGTFSGTVERHLTPSDESKVVDIPMNVGGVVGYNTGTVGGTTDDEKCENSGTVTSNITVEGVTCVKEPEGDQVTDITANISTNVGGIVGFNAQSTGTVKGCTNSGTVNGDTKIIGVDENNVNTVNGYTNIGGVVGKNQSGEVSGTSNSGAVNGKTDTSFLDSRENVSGSGISYIGGVAGFNEDGTLKDSNNSGIVTGDKNVGGVVGTNSNGTVNNCMVKDTDGTILYKFTFPTVTTSVKINGSNPPYTAKDAEGSNVAVYAKSGTKITFTYDNIDDKFLKVTDGTTTIGGISITGTANEYEYTMPEKDATVTLTANFPETLAKDGYNYLIKTDYDLQSLAKYFNAGNDCNGLTFKLANTIDLSKINNFTPIGTSEHAFKGTFDGGSNEGYTISGLKITGTADNVGLFGKVGGGKVQNVTLTDVNISGQNNVGGVVGSNDGTVENCKVSGTVSGDDYVGGIVGYNVGSVKGSTNIGKIESTGENSQYIGGVVGYNSGTVDDKSYYYKNDTTNYTNTNGKRIYKIILPDDVTIKSVAVTSGNDTYCTEDVTLEYSGEYLKKVGDDFIYTDNGKFSLHLTGDTEIQTAATFFDTIEKDSTDSTGNTYLIKTVEDLKRLAAYVSNGNNMSDKTFKLAPVDKDGNSIDTLDLSSIDNWTPIGTSSKPFKGTFDGNGKTINGLKITGTADNVGLFGYLDGGMVKNVNFTGVNISGKNNVGGVVGYSNSGTVEKCKVSGVINGTSSVGGIVGFNYCGTVSGNISFSSVTGSSNFGGIVGKNEGNTTVIDCYYYKSSDALNDMGNGDTGNSTQIYKLTLPTNVTITGDIIEFDGNYYAPANATVNFTFNGTGEIPPLEFDNDTKAFLKSIVIGSGVTKINEDAFKDCTSLTTVDLKDCTNLTTINKDAFSGCTSLTTVDLRGCTNLTTISKDAFSGCTSLTTIKVGLEGKAVVIGSKVIGVGTLNIKEAVVTDEVNLSYLDCENINYIGSNGTATASAIQIRSGLTELAAGTYIVKGETTLNDLRLNGEVNFILADGANLTAGKISGGTINVYGQGGNTLGKLTVDEISSTLNHNGGNVTARTISNATNLNRGHGTFTVTDSLTTTNGKTFTINNDSDGVQFAVSEGAVTSISGLASDSSITCEDKTYKHWIDLPSGANATGDKLLINNKNCYANESTITISGFARGEISFDSSITSLTNNDSNVIAKFENNDTFTISGLTFSIEKIDWEVEGTTSSYNHTYTNGALISGSKVTYRNYSLETLVKVSNLKSGVTLNSSNITVMR